MNITLGLGKAKVAIEMTRADGSVDRVVFDSLMVSDTENGSIEVEEEEIWGGHPGDIIRREPVTGRIYLEGSVIKDAAGTYARVETGTDSILKDL